MSKAEANALQDVRALVVDDEEAIRRMITVALSGAGAIVDTAGDGAEGLQVLLRHDFDVMVVDLRMQGMDGITFLQEALRIWPWLGVVVITGYADDDCIARANELGVTRILSKPLQLDNLRKNVMEEARAKRERVVLSTNATPERAQNQLRVLRQLTHTAMASSNLVEALRHLSSGLAQFLPCAVAGILGLEDEDHLLLLSAQSAVSTSFLKSMEDEICRRYEVLSGRPLDRGTLHTDLEGTPADPDGPAKAGSTLSVPVITDGKCRGLLTLAAVSDNAYDSSDISFLYHAAYHLSTVFAALSRMRQMAVRDALTGLYNRRHLEEELERAWLLSGRYNHSMCAVIVDIDQFKDTNDTCGHLVADQALREFAEVLQHVARASDIIARYGGDEFVVILPQAEPEEARSFCDWLLVEVHDRIFCQATHPIRLTVSIGVSDTHHTHAPDSTDEFLAQADKALYAAKRGGRNQVRFWADLESQTTDMAAPPSLALSLPSDADEKTHIMVVDDDSSILNLLSQLLDMEGYAVATASSVPEAIAALTGSQGVFSVVITDLEMPGKGGLDLLRELSAADASIITIVISGHATADNAIACLRQGAYDFVEKPLNHDQLLAAVSRAAEYHRLLEENTRYHDSLEDMVRVKSAALADALDEVKRSYNFTLEALVAMLDARESNTGQHSLRVRDISVIVARGLGITGDDLDNVARGALLHDIGKIGVPDKVLLKPGPLNEVEWEIMKTHPDVGYRFLATSSYLTGAAEIVRSHQEKFDGTGYPRGLRGDEICLGARIFALGDAYDAMRSDRVYRKAMKAEEAIAEIRRCAGSHFDPELIEAFLACQEAIENQIYREPGEAPAAQEPEQAYPRSA